METPDVVKKDEEVIQKPSRYVVILQNDDYTEAMTVATAIQETFGVPSESAFNIMMAAHNHGRAVVASYGSKDVAETKADNANAIVKSADPEYTEVFFAEKDV